MILGYQGEPGAFSEEAAHALVAGAQTRGFTTFDELIGAADAREIDLALIPVENSIYGPIARTYDLLWDHPSLAITDETVHRVVQTLIGVAGARIDDIREVRSHPVALEQCRRFLAGHPGWKTRVVDDTAGAVREIVAGGERSVAAIAASSAAERYGAAVLAGAIQDDDDNFTRFFLVARDGTSRRTLGRACVALSLAHRPGSLRDALSAFADLDLNLRSLVSRPSRAEAFTYRFYCEVENARPDVLERALERIGGEHRILGFY